MRVCLGPHVVFYPGEVVASSTISRQLPLVSRTSDFQVCVYVVAVVEGKDGLWVRIVAGLPFSESRRRMEQPPLGAA